MGLEQLAPQGLGKASNKEAGMGPPPAPALSDLWILKRQDGELPEQGGVSGHLGTFLCFMSLQLGQKRECGPLPGEEARPSRSSACGAPVPAPCLQPPALRWDRGRLLHHWEC